jgi:hypothetical protein
LKGKGINIGDEELKELVNLIKFKDNDTDKISLLERYANGHLL